MAGLNVTIDNIKSKLLRPALTSHYICEIAFPASAAFRNYAGYSIPLTSDLTEKLILSCCETSLPGSAISTHDLINDFTGVNQKHAHRRLYDDRADFTFYIDTEYTQIRFFEMWMRYISGEDLSIANNLNNHYRMAYPKNYKTSITITKFERDSGSAAKNSTFGSNLTSVLGAQKIQYNFVNAFPTNVNSMPVSYDSGQLLKYVVSFSYDRYYATDRSFSGFSANPPEPQPNIPSGLAQNPYSQSNFNIDSLSTYTNNFRATQVNQQGLTNSIPFGSLGSLIA